LKEGGRNRLIEVGKKEAEKEGFEGCVREGNMPLVPK
jgi:hypothetical protein